MQGRQNPLGGGYRRRIETLGGGWIRGSTVRVGARHEHREVIGSCLFLSGVALAAPEVLFIGLGVAVPGIVWTGFTAQSRDRSYVSPPTGSTANKRRSLDPLAVEGGRAGRMVAASRMPWSGTGRIGPQEVIGMDCNRLRRYSIHQGIGR